ncbi:MAG TPA: 50S ribosomal protein L24e, partial [Candidatus Thalassarchaeaceae archaeon]
EPGTGIMFVRRDGTVLWFKDSKARKNHVNLNRNPRRLKWTRRYEKGGIK